MPGHHAGLFCCTRACTRRQSDAHLRLRRDYCFGALICCMDEQTPLHLVSSTIRLLPSEQIPLFIILLKLFQFELNEKPYSAVKNETEGKYVKIKPS